MLRRVVSARGPAAFSRIRHASTFFHQRQPFRLNRVQAAVGVSAITVLAIGFSGFMLDTGTHMWLERRLWRLKSTVDSETQEWGWDLEAERWTGDAEGGTDRALGRQGRKAVRDAWFSHHSPEKYGPLDDEEAASSGATNVVDAMLLRTEALLRSAIAIAEQPEIAGKLHSSTLPDLLTRRAGILERLGPSHLMESRAQYERVFRLLGGDGLQAARTAVKMGDVSQRLGEGRDALAWWARAVQLASGEETGAQVPEVPPVPSASPAAQRILFTALVSTSAAYAMARQLSQAQKIEEDALNLLRSIRPPDTFASASPPQALHSLLLLHRSAILSPPPCGAAATSSERVAYALVGTSVRDSDELAPSVDDRLLGRYTKNPYLEKPASDLLRDARRSAADMWNLLGELTERMGPSHTKLALDYYTRAVGWAGKTNKEGIMERADSTLEDDWVLIFRNYTRLKQKVTPS
ncbi:hypothetical protein MSAN_00999900 [Mycena sanguinolenta]|uniref:Uncharacterized protein n=1 Tax=Mycena sanguinolenta TaxID=230812 RepID=A0A8H6YSB5_9AGAR|nr:hypothetical protein MSAN_00999900 [Mycena sanguinolenta]